MNCELVRVDGGLCKGKGRPDGAGSWRPVPGRSADALTMSERPNGVTESDDTPFPAFEEGRAVTEVEVTVAQRKLSLLLDRNEGEPQDFTEAAAWFCEAAAQGNASAQATLGEIYEFGDGVDRDMATAVGWYRKAADQGNLKAQVLLADLYADEFSEYHSYRKARKWLRKAARQGEISSQARLGFLYYEGRGGKRRRKKAVAWIHKAAERGDGRAQLFLGHVYAHGEVLPRDAEVAAAWYRRAAERGIAEAQFGLGVMYSEGDGVARDAVQVLALLATSRPGTDTCPSRPPGPSAANWSAKCHHAISARHRRSGGNSKRGSRRSGTGRSNDAGAPGGGVGVAGREPPQLQVSAVEGRNARRRMRARLFPSGLVRLLELLDQVDDVSGAGHVPKVQRPDADGVADSVEIRLQVFQELHHLPGCGSDTEHSLNA